MRRSTHRDALDFHLEDSSERYDHRYEAVERDLCLDCLAAIGLPEIDRRDEPESEDPNSSNRPIQPAGPETVRS